MRNEVFMILILWLIILMLLIITYQITDFNITAPSIIVLISFFLVTSSSVIYSFFLDFSISELTVGIVVTFLFCIILGNVISSNILNNKTYNAKSRRVVKYNIGKNLLAIYIILTIIGVYISYQDVVASAKLLSSNISDQTLLLLYAREAYLQGIGIRSFGVQYYMQASNCFAHVSMYCLVSNIINYGWEKDDIKFLIPIIFLFIYTFLDGGGRTGFIRSFFYIFMFITILLRIKYYHNIRTINQKVIIIAGLAFIMFILFFFLLKYFRGGEFDLFDQIFRYFGASIPALDQFINGNVLVKRNIDLFGSNTLFGIYKSIAKLGFDIPQLYPPAEFVYIDYLNTNIYTAIMRYIQDFGYFLTFVIAILYGVVYGWGDFIVLKNKLIGFPIVMYVFLASPLCEMAIEERFFMNIVSIVTIEQILVMYFIYNYLIKMDKRC